MNDTQTCQPALDLEGSPCALSIEWDARTHAAALLERLAALPCQPGVLLGIGGSLLASATAPVAGYTPFAALRAGRYTFPATPHDLWTLVLADSPSGAFEAADALRRALGTVARISEVTTLFSYRGGRDLTGFKDGSANPAGDAAHEAALIGAGDFRGGSFALVQRWLHFRDRFLGQAASARDAIIGRSEATDVELEDAPASSHVRRVDQERTEPGQFILRRSMPWGDVRRNGLQFIALCHELAPLQTMLERMLGLVDGPADALLGHSQAETGAYYFVPPVRAGRYVLPGLRATAIEHPPTPGAVAAPATMPATTAIARIHENGPLAIEGDCRVGGRAEQRAALCRCGESRNKPYCDGSHVKAGFCATGEPEPLAPEEPVAAAGPVAIQPIADGPLVVHGAMEIISASGRTISRAPGPTLCRCGHSANKPFCDGSHARAGFRAPE